MFVVLLNQSTHQRLAAYAKLTGQPVSAVANEAFNHWMDTIGDVMIEELETPRKREAGTLMQFPARPA